MSSGASSRPNGRVATASASQSVALALLLALDPLAPLRSASSRR